MMELQTTQSNNNGGGMMQVASSREAQGVQAAMVVAQRFPRDTTRSYGRIIEDCKRKSLAEKAVYSYPRGGQTISGPSIRLAESMARAWGNLDFGIVELERKPSMGNVPGESVIQSYCYDLETNTKSTKVFTVRHSRDKNVKDANGNKRKIQETLTDERDIYEMVANQGARRLRSCILSIIPVDIVEDAVEQCEKTMEGGQGPLVDRVRSMVVYFKSFGVTQEMIEKKLQHKIEATSEAELVSLKKIATSLKDNFGQPEDYFDLPQTNEAKAEAAAETEKPKNEPKSIKNFAPGASNHPEEKKADRNESIKRVLTAQAEIKMSAKDLASFTDNLFKKKMADLTIEEIDQLAGELEHMKT